MPSPAGPEATTIATPCVRICAVEPASGLCLGCGRSLREIGAWRGYSDAMRHEVMAALPRRLAWLKAKRDQALPDDQNAP